MSETTFTEDCDEFLINSVSLLVANERVGLAAYQSAMCRVTCCEVAVSLARLDERPIQSLMDVPSDLMWLVQFFSVHHPGVVLVPSIGSQVILDVAALCDVGVTLTAPSMFDSGRIWDILSALWPDVTPVAWHGRVSPYHHTMLMALSALLLSLQRGDCAVADVAEVAPAGLLYVDCDTLAALQIMRAERHPMDFQGIGRSKEGLSLLSVVDRTCSVIGRALLRQWFVLPLRDATELNRRYDVVAFFTRQEYYELMLRLRCALKRLRSPGAIFTKMRAATHTTSDYGSLLDSVQGFLRIAEALLPHAHALQSFMCIVASCQKVQLEEMARLIRCAIDFSRNPNESLSKTYVCIRPGYDPVLDELRAHVQCLDDVLTGVAQAESRDLPREWGPCTVVCVFAPQWGYVVTVSSRSLSSPMCTDLIAGSAPLPPGWELALRADDGFVFKTPQTRRLDAALGDVRAAVLAREADVQRRLDARLLELSPALIPLSRCAELDCLIGFAMCAREGQWARPELCADAGVLFIERGLHPILARTAAQAPVAFSLTVQSPADRVCVVTGANGSGKSVLVAAATQIVFLAHIGSFVPSARAVMGVVDTLLATHAATAAVGRGAARELRSSFGGELSSLSRMLHRCAAGGGGGGGSAERALLVMDEFGKGTLATDGAALLAAALRFIVSLGDKRPMVLLATHYTEALHPQLVPRTEVQMLEMLTTLAPSGGNGAGEATGEREEDMGNGWEPQRLLVHSYRVMCVSDGNKTINTHEERNTNFHALRFALQFSVPDVLIERARDIIMSEEL